MFSRIIYSRHISASVRNKDKRAIVFVDAKISNYANIVQKVNPQARAFILGSQVNGIQSITQVLTDSMCQEVHIVATGSPGCLYLGNQELSLNTLIQYEDELKDWFDLRTQKTVSRFASAKSWIDSLPIVPSLSFYGCNLAAGDVGTEFIESLCEITKAQISASRDVLRHEVFCNGERKSQL